MSDAKWIPEGTGNQLTYTKGDFTIMWKLGQYGLQWWEARHHDKMIKSGDDAGDLMDYCDEFVKRLSDAHGEPRVGAWTNSPKGGGCNFAPPSGYMPITLARISWYCPRPKSSETPWMS